MNLPGAVHGVAVFTLFNGCERSPSLRSMGRYRHEVRPTIGELHAALRQRDLHHVAREIARWMSHVLPPRGDATQCRVVVGAEMRAANPSPAGGHERAQR